MKAGHWHCALTGIALFLSVGQAWGCTSVEALPVFTPDVKAETERWLFSLPERVQRKVDESLRQISARVVSVRRPQPDDVCHFGTANIKVEVRWAEPTVTRLDEVGIYFKVVSGADGPGKAGHLSALPRVATMENGIAYVYLEVEDKDSRPREKIDLDVEVFAVDKLLRIGPSSRLRVQSDD